MLAVLVATAAVVLPGASPWLIGVTVAVGALTQILGDWLTRSGVPLAWPMVHRGKRWWLFRSPVAFVTGKSRVEDAIRWAFMVSGPAVGMFALVGA
ncbi:metal-dependent hydrolase [Nocardiopsis sp. YSL2]|uniref:metal-dependent hydrolase n=1 Tax=Nocardiopsis sp. YSL2 TaxID=2939492 RepID=UPI0026F4557A|nr:metal-dependent hydrolase [Nocardiopsis sp. YSL2]